MSESAAAHDAVECARALVRTDTTGGDEGRLTTMLAPCLEQAGFRVEMLPMAPGRVNLVATFAGGGGLMLAGHLDTVPVGGGWSADPFSGELADGRLFGRGASDMKGGLAAMLVAALRHVGRRARAGFTVVFTAGEETGCAGASFLASGGHLSGAELVVIPESTDNELRYGHRGATWLRVVAQGKAAHASTPQLGSNAIEDVARVVEALPAIVEGHRHPELGAATASAGAISGGTQPNIVPDWAELTIDVRTVPGMEVSELERDLVAMMRSGFAERILDLPPVWSDPRSERAAELAAAVAAVTGRVTAVGGTPYFTDAAAFDQDQTDAFIVGPGDPVQPHTADESCAVERISESVEVYSSILDRWERGKL